MDFFKNEGEYINAEPVNINFDDEEDKKFYEVFIRGKADYLVTGNIVHFPVEKYIVNPTDFLKSFFANNTD